MSESTNHRVTMADAGVPKLDMGEYTGRYLIAVDPDDVEGAAAALHKTAGVPRPEVLRGQDAEQGSRVLEQDGSVVLGELGVMVVSAAPDQRPGLKTAVQNTSSLLAVEPERILYACTAAPYAMGYRDGVLDTVKRLVDSSNGQPSSLVSARPDESVATWGINAIGAFDTALTGRGVGVAVLDTGVDHRHDDLAGRITQSKSFVPNEPDDDLHGHGTHCIGTACGPANPANAPRYGVASESMIFAVKVLGASGTGPEGQIMAGVNWAVAQQRIKVISMSLGTRISRGAGFSRIFEQAARQAMRRGKVIIAAAGNDSDRPGRTEPVSHPANCPSVMAVGAVGSDFKVAWFSNAGLNGDGGELNLVGPGVEVLSAVPGGGYDRLSGTSMATPHVSGVAAQLWQQRPTATAQEIWNDLVTTCRALPIPRVDGGAGLVQAPRGQL